MGGMAQWCQRLIMVLRRLPGTTAMMAGGHTMPIMAPLAEFANTERHLIVTAYQSANGLVNLINPTFAVVMGGLLVINMGWPRQEVCNPAGDSVVL